MRSTVCSPSGRRSVKTSIAIMLLRRQAMSAHRKQAQANSAVATSVDQLIGWPSIRMTPPRKIRITIRMRNTEAIHVSAAHIRA